jgi:hypothetical protein
MNTRSKLVKPGYGRGDGADRDAPAVMERTERDDPMPRGRKVAASGAIPNRGNPMFGKNTMGSGSCGKAAGKNCMGSHG